MKRAIRRHHRQRKINHFFNIYHICWCTMDVDREEKLRWARLTTGRGSIGCGCTMCANPRRNGWDNPLTRSEQKAEYYLNKWEDEH